MMGFDDIVIGFIISYVAGTLPSLKRFFKKKEEGTLKESLEEGYNQAVSKWASGNPIKENYLRKELADISQFKDFFKSPGRKNKVAIIEDIINVWAEEIRKNDSGIELIISLKTEDLGEIKDILSNLKIETNKKDLPIISRGLIKHNPVDG